MWPNRLHVLTSSALTVLVGLGAAAADDPAPSSSPKVQELTVGEPLPSLESTDDTGRTWKASDHVGKKILVLYLYPGDFTGGCIKQARAFREGLARLEELGVEVVGISGDDVATHQLFRESHALKHTLLADPEGALARQLGIPVQRGAKVRARDLDGRPLMNGKNKSIIVERKVTLPRWTFVIGRDGKLVSKRTEVNPATDTEEVLKIVQTLTPY